MAEQNSPPNDDRPLIRRGRVDIVDLYEVQEAELQILEKGSSATLLFNIAIFLLSSAFTCVAALVTSDFKWQIAETIFIFFSVLGFMLGTCLMIIWWRNRTSVAKVVSTIRNRINGNST